MFSFFLYISEANKTLKSEPTSNQFLQYLAILQIGDTTWGRINILLLVGSLILSVKWHKLAVRRVVSKVQKIWQLCASSFPSCYFLPPLGLVNHAKTITQNTVSLLPITRMNQFVLIVWFLATWLAACNQLVKVLTTILPTRLATWTTTPNIIGPSILWRNQRSCTLKTATLVSSLEHIHIHTFIFHTFVISPPSLDLPSQQWI